MTFISVNCLINTLSTDVSVRTLCIHQLERVLYGGCYLRRALLESSQQQGMSEKEKRKKKQPTHICCSAYHNGENKDIFWEEYSQPPHQHTHSGAFIIAACTSTTDPKVPD